MNWFTRFWQSTVLKDFYNVLKKGNLTMSDLTALKTAVDAAAAKLASDATANAQVTALTAQVADLTAKDSASQVEIDALTAKLNAAVTP